MNNQLIKKKKVKNQHQGHTLKIVYKDVDGKKQAIFPAKSIPGVLSRVQPLQHQVNYGDCTYLLGSYNILLKEVKGEEVNVTYKLYSLPAHAHGPLNWNVPLADVPLRLHIQVGRAEILVYISPTCMERNYSKNGVKDKALFRKASDSRGYNDTYILSDWSLNDVCFYLRTHILNYIVDKNPMSPYLEVWKAIVWKHEALSKERLCKISGSSYELNPEELQKIEWVEEVKVRLGEF